MSDAPTVLITDFIHDALEPERAVLAGLANVRALDAKCEEELAGRIEDALFLIVYHTISVRRPTIERLRRCRLIVRGGVGYDNIDCDSARERGIPVANVPAYGTEDVADTAIGLMLALTRGFAQLNSRMRDGADAWTHTYAAPLHRLAGRVYGVIGAGRIGTAAALRAKALRMDVCIYDPYKPDGYEKALGVRRVESLEDLLAQSFAVSLHCPLTSETRHMIDAAAIACMPRGSYLVNTARGAVVDTSAIPAAIESGHLAGAAIDVLEKEPPPADDDLLRAWRDANHPAYHRVLITPHAAFYTEEGATEMRATAADTCRRMILGLPVRSIVNA